MSRLFTHALASALAGAVASVATLAAAFLLFPAIVFEMDRDIPRATAGFSPVERHLDATYAWSGQRAQVDRGRRRDRAHRVGHQYLP
jgi:hypothetical protein